MGKEIGTATINTKDRFGNDLTISYSGVDQRELAHFGGLDLHVTATKEMISDSSGLSFPEKEGDFLIREKVAALYLNEIGEFLRYSSIDSDMFEGYTNIDLVKDFLKNLDHPDVLRVIKKDDELMQKQTEEIRREEDEIWSNIMKDMENR